MAAGLVTAQGRLNAREQTLGSLNAGLWEEVQGQWEEIEGLVGGVEGGVGDLEGAGGMME